MAILEKLFSKITFKNYPDTSTPVNADNLNKMSDAIDGIDDRVVELNSNLEFHKGDTFTYTKAIFGTGLSSSNGKAFSFAIYLPKNISSDVTSVTITDDISNIRTTGKNVPLTNAYTQVLAFDKNMVEVALNSDDISALAYHTGVIRPPVTFTFE